MRWVFGLLLSLCIGCATSSSLPAGESSATSVDVSIPSPPPGPDRVERRRAERATDLSGTWRFVHGGEPWFVARIHRRGSRWTANLTFVEEVSWVRFEIRRFIVPRQSRGRIVLVGVDEDEEEREISLRMSTSGAKMEGSVEGSSYTEPFPVVATRVR